MNIFQRVPIGICAALVVLSFSFASRSAVASKKLQVNLDYATFRYDSMKTYFELYYSFSAASAHLVKKDSSFTGLLVFDVLIKSSIMDTVVDQQLWK
ncbi:MAG TPA: hypothetical protein VLX91_12765, partial [Candidatus Acidoferrales bacterium]|nr:hypothetical protein [Candidatus Acidoferrales bacterium]